MISGLLVTSEGDGDASIRHELITDHSTVPKVETRILEAHILDKTIFEML